jgi:ribonuclease VapC
VLRDEAGQEFVETMIDTLTVVPFDSHQLAVARAAHQRYGRGSGHPARLNFGDCFSYALAVTTGEALLFKGNDFALTDVTPAYVPG